MSNYSFPVLDFNSKSESMQTIKIYAQLLSEIKRHFTPPQKYKDEQTLQIYAKGYTTSTIPVIAGGKVETLDLNLNFLEHQLKIFCGKARLSVDLQNKSIMSFNNELSLLLSGLSVDCHFISSKFSDKRQLYYNPSVILDYWKVINQVYFIMLHFKSGIMNETSCIYFDPEKLSLGLLLFTGKIIDGKESKNWLDSQENISIEFSTGNDIYCDPFFSVSCNSENENTFYLSYEEFRNKENPNLYIINFLNSKLPQTIKRI